MVNETFSGLISSAGVIAASVIALLLEMRKGRGQVGKMLDYLRNSSMGNVDEKIAVLYMYTNNVRTWRASGINVDHMTSQICSDLLSIGRVSNNMTLEQWIELHRALRILIETMKAHDFDTSRIEDMRNALS